MKPEKVNAESTPITNAASRLPSHATTKKMLLATAVVYAAWLVWMGYVAWVNVQAGNQ